MNKFELSTMSIVKFIAIVLGFYLIYMLREIALLLFIVMIIVMIILKPKECPMCKYRFKRGSRS